MSALSPRSRRNRADITRGGIVLALVAFVGAASLALGAGGNASAAASNGGALSILAGDGAAAGSPLGSGAVDTKFTLQPPTGAACSGDTATGEYKVQSYMVPSSVDPSSLTFGNTGPLPTGVGASFRQPLFALGSPFVNKNTAVTTGLLTALPAFDFTAWQPNSSASIPAGIYNIGYACSKGLAGVDQLDKYWNVQITVSDNAGEVAWLATPIAPPPSSSSSTTPASSSTTPASSSTTPASSSTSLVSSSTSSSVVSSTSSSAVSTSSSSSVVDTTTESTFSSSTALVDYGSGGGGLGNTGADTSTIIAWGVTVLFLGRMVQLLARRVRVISSDHR